MNTLYYPIVWEKLPNSNFSRGEENEEVSASVICCDGSAGAGRLGLCTCHCGSHSATSHSSSNGSTHCYRGANRHRSASCYGSTYCCSSESHTAPTPCLR